MAAILYSPGGIGPVPIPDLDARLFHERHMLSSAYETIAGVDEVGRGALAGPLVAAAVVLPSIDEILAERAFWNLVHDSKTMSHPRRVILATGIRNRARAVQISAVAPHVLDAIGLGPANRMAMECAVLGLSIDPDLLLIDAMTLDIGLPQLGIIDGDARSLSIAAASIVAKVARDSVMCDLDRHYPVFGFARHKGYGVASHLAALGEHGPCEHHRQSFAPVRLSMEVRHVSG
ncbi:MAG: ribonuclease HII [Thermomicrobiales bacterium]